MTRPAEKALSEVLQQVQYEVWAEDLVPPPVSAPPGDVWTLLRIIPGYLRGVAVRLSWRVSAWLTSVTNLWHVTLFGEAGRPRPVHYEHGPPVSSTPHDIEVADLNRRLVRERIGRVKEDLAGQISERERGKLEARLKELEVQHRQITDELIRLVRERLEAVRERLATGPYETTRKLLEAYMIRLTHMLSELVGDDTDE